MRNTGGGKYWIQQKGKREGRRRRSRGGIKNEGRTDGKNFYRKFWKILEIEEIFKSNISGINLLNLKILRIF